jgi:tetratricopeptide (TPR) repeat protein
VNFSERNLTERIQKRLPKDMQSQESEQLKKSFASVMAEVAKQIPQITSRQQIKTAEVAIPHLKEVALHLDEWVNDQDLAWLFIGLSNFYENQGAYTESLPWCERCLEKTQSRFGKMHPTIADSINNLGYLHHLQDHFEESEKFYLQALEIRIKLFGNNHTEVAQSLNNLASIYHETGQYNKAEKFHRKSLKLRKVLCGDRDWQTAQSLNNLASVYKAQGRYEEAEPLFIQSLELRKQLGDETTPEVIESLHNLAGLYVEQGRYDLGSWIK